MRSGVLAGARPWIAAGAAALALGAALAGCLRNTSFVCASNADCTGSAPGRCESVGFCSFADESCSSGNRFGDQSGPYAGKCVGELGSDAGIDAGADARADASPDAPPDAPPPKCPSTYAALPGAGTHVYHVITTTAPWATQRTLCTGDRAYLVEPNDATELAAINMLVGAFEIWVGISDQATEGTFVTGRGAAATFLPWETGEPDNAPQQGGGGDCVRSSAAGTYADDRCNATRRAVCECEP